MSHPILASKTFHLADLVGFGGLSGDTNPMHVDAVRARRTQAGAVVAHGMHAVLWALESLLETCPGAGRINAVKIRFETFIHLGDPVAVTLASRGDREVVLEVHTSTARAATIAVGFGEMGGPIAGTALGEGVVVGSSAAEPLEHELASLRTLRGFVACASSPAAYAAAFPRLASGIGTPHVASLATLCKLSGMVCPGLHSITSAITVDLTSGQDTDGGIHFATTKLERFRLVSMTLSGGGLSGKMQSFARYPPVAQPCMNDVAASVDPRAFAGSKALIIGGSRGLGETTAKIVAAGGGEVILTYFVGRSDAENVAREISEFGGSSSIRCFDARDDVAMQLRELSPTHVYYFATPRIPRPKSTLYSHSLFAEFSAVYVSAFYDVCRVLAASRPTVLFYPSTTQIGKRPRSAGEYAMSKAAGELLCADIDRFMPEATVVVRRLPSLLTDQTANVVPIDVSPTLEVMLPVVHAVQAHRVEAPRPP